MRRQPGLNSWFELVAESRRIRVVPHARGVRSSFRRRGRSCGIHAAPACGELVGGRLATGWCPALDHGEHAAPGHGFHGFVEQLDPVQSQNWVCEKARESGRLGLVSVILRWARKV